MTQAAVIPYSEPQNVLALAGQVADKHAGASAFADYRIRQAANTRDRQAHDLALFARFLQAAGVPSVGDLAEDVTAWAGISWGLLEAFLRWQLSEGYAVGSCNVRLATVKTYAGLAVKAGVIAPEQGRLIATVKGYSRKEGRHVDAAREVSRMGAKKAEAVPIAPEQAAQLKAQPADTPQGRRDMLMMCLLLDHGLRVGEVAILEVAHFDMARGEFRFYRPKVDKEQTHKMTADTLRAVRAYFDAGDAPAMGPLLRGSRRGGGLAGSGVSERAITKRVGELGRRVGIARLSAHDCRHFWATIAVRNGTDIRALQEAGGWASPAMPLRYAEVGRVANEGVKLG
jgi:integrase